MGFQYQTHSKQLICGNRSELSCQPLDERIPIYMGIIGVESNLEARLDLEIIYGIDYKYK